MKLENDDLKEILNKFEILTKKREVFVSNEDNLTEEIRSLVKTFYDFIKLEEIKCPRTSTLPELITENFDLEQIWQQLELQNEEVLDRSLVSVSKYLLCKDRLIFTELNENNEREDDLLSEDENAESNVDDSVKSDNSSDSSEANVDSDSEIEDEAKKSNKRIKPSIADDQFFKLNEMENFLTAEEQRLNSNNKQHDSSDDDDDDNQESIDLFAADSEADEENDRLHNPKYDDFFGESKNNQKAKSLNFFESEEKDQSKLPELKSSLELREERLKAKIETIEQAALSEKPWQLKGEITGDNRPHNSLLQEVVEFDLTTRPAPVITEQTTFQLEDIIRQRIKDRVFDSVQRKHKPVETPLEYKKKLVLNQEKSKESLAQIYEKDFLRQQEAVNSNAADKEEPEPELHKEIKTMLHGLFLKLDALSNFHFTPHMATPELKIVSNLPAISMEEVAPLAMSHATLLAPEEVKAKTKSTLIGKGERTATDKKRERRKKKLKQKQHANEQKKTDKFVNKSGLGNKHSKEKARKLLEKAFKSGGNVEKMNEGFEKVKSSTAFFKQLEEDVRSQIKSKSKMAKNTKHNLNAKKIKL